MLFGDYIDTRARGSLSRWAAAPSHVRGTLTGLFRGDMVRTRSTKAQYPARRIFLRRRMPCSL